MPTLIHLSIDEGPALPLKLGRTLSDEEKRRVLQTVAAFVRTLQVWMEAGERERPKTTS